MELKTRFIVLVEVLCIIATNWTIRHYKLQIESWFWLVVFGRTVALVKLFLEHFEPEDKLLFLLWRMVLNELTTFIKWIMWETLGFVYPLMVITILEKQQLLSEEDAMLMQSILLAMELIFNLLAMSNDNMRFVVAPHQFFTGVALSVHLLNSLDIQDPVVAILSVIFLFGSVVAWGVAENEKMDDKVRLGAKFGYTLAFGVCSVLFGQQLVSSKMVHLVVKVLAGLDIASFLACLWINNHYNLDPNKNEYIWGDMVIMFRVSNFIRLCLTYYDPNEFHEDAIMELRTLVKRIQILLAWLMFGDVYPEMVSVICKRFYSGLYATYYPSRLLYLTTFCLRLGSFLALYKLRLNRIKLGRQVASALTLMFHFVAATKAGDSWGVWGVVWMACVLCAWIIEEDERNNFWLRFWARNFVNLGFTVTHFMFAKQLKRRWYII